MATHMLEIGTDIRFIQAMQGDEDITSTQIYNVGVGGEAQGDPQGDPRDGATVP